MCLRATEGDDTSKSWPGTTACIGAASGGCIQAYKTTVNTAGLAQVSNSALLRVGIEAVIVQPEFARSGHFKGLSLLLCSIFRCCFIRIYKSGHHYYQQQQDRP